MQYIQLAQTIVQQWSESHEQLNQEHRSYFQWCSGCQNTGHLRNLDSTGSPRKHEDLPKQLMMNMLNFHLPDSLNLFEILNKSLRETTWKVEFFKWKLTISQVCEVESWVKIHKTLKGKFVKILYYFIIFTLWTPIFKDICFNHFFLVSKLSKL